MRTIRQFVPLILVGIASLLLWTAVASSAAADSTIRYVATDGADSGGCDTIAGRCLTVQYTVGQADPGDEIRIASGTYDEVNNAGGLSQVVYLTKTLTLRGGYSPDFSAWDPTAYPTTLDAVGQGRVLYITGAISPTVESLRITGGDATGLGGGWWSGDGGGGVYIATATATLSRTIISNNRATYDTWSDGSGGGVYLLNSDARILNNTINDNDATTAGGTFGGTGWGGGLAAEGGAPLVRGNTVLNNQASPGTGFLGDGHGGGLYFVEGQPTVEANQIRDNRAVGSGSMGSGGGIQLDGCPDFELVNNILAANTGGGYGGNGVYMGSMSGQPSQGRLLHTTVADNQGMAGTGGVRVTGQGTVVTLTNTIIAGHETGINVSFGATATLTATLWSNDTDWGDVGDIFTGTINLWGNPEFLSPGSGDYHIAVSSPARNQGVEAGVSTDIDGEPRDANPDLGADEAGAQSLQVVKSASTIQLYPGNSLTYTIAVHSAGTLSVTHVALTDTFPALQRPLGVSFDQGSCAIPDPGYGGLVTCTLGDLEAGQSAHITLTAQVTSTLPPDPPHLMRNNALATGDQAQASTYADTVLDAPPNCLARINGALPDYTVVQTAVDAASPGDEVWIAGTCRGAFERNGLYQQVHLAKDLSLRGGYSLDFGTWDPAAYPTTLDAEGQGRVVYATGSAAVSLEHLRLTGGDATGLGGSPDGFGDAGGGLYALSAMVTLSGCQVAENVATSAPFGTGYGGGAAIYTATLTAVATSWTGNTGASDSWGSGYGGALFAEGAIFHLENNLIQENAASGGPIGTGGGTCAYHSEVQAGATLWLSNTVSALGLGFGGGLYVGYDSPFTLTNCVWRDNRAGDGSGNGGSALQVEGAAGMLLQPTIAHNRDGVAVGADYTATLAITNAVIVSHNVGIKAEGASLVTVDGVLWHANVSDTIAVSATIQVGNAYSGDPAFGPDGYHLSSYSQALDRGVASGVATDVDGQMRPSGSGYDLGADEFQCAASVALDGPTSGYAGRAYEFSALAGPPAATLPLTYTWQTTDFPPAVRQGGITDAISYLWPTTGTKTITITAQNCPVPVSDTQTIEIVECVALAGVALDGPLTTTLGLPAVFTATVAPANAIQPITYTWQPSGQPAQVHPGGGLSETLVLTWTATGVQSVTVTARNECGTAVSETHLLTITNVPPVADAGPDRDISVGAVVVLDGSGSHDPDGHYPLAYRWTQSGGLEVVLDDPHVVSPTFTAPDTATVLTFTLAVTDAYGLAGLTPDEVVITVACVAPAGVTLSGPPTATVGSTSLFIATVRPITTTPPLTYTWQATGRPPLMHVGALSDTAVLTWSMAGPQAVTVTVESRCGAVVSGTRTLTVEAGEQFVYLPLVLRASP
jgi:uncharacterized repeat protein (TIGR01451 family)